MLILKPLLLILVTLLFPSSGLSEITNHYWTEEQLDSPGKIKKGTDYFIICKIRNQNNIGTDIYT